MTPEALLLTGEFGAGKTSVAVEIADILENAGAAYAVIDLDWLCWGVAGDHRPGAEHRMLLRNLAPVVTNYRDAGATRFVLARAVHDLGEVTSVRDTMGMPLHVVRLDVPWSVIEARLSTDVTSGRADDLREARDRIATGAGTGPAMGPADHVIDGDRPLREVALDVVGLVGWG